MIDMQKIKMAVFSTDPQYNKFFNEYLKESKYVNRINVFFYTDENFLLEDYKTQTGHVLLTEKMFDDKDVMRFERVIKLEESNTVDLTESLYKYQPFDNIISNIMSKYYAKNGELSSTSLDKEASILAFSSASGGVGKTTLALCLSKFLSQHDRKILYLSLEKMQATSKYLKSSLESSAELFYYLQDDKYRLMEKIEELKSKDDHTGIEFFNLPLNPEELENLDAVMVENLIESIKSSGNYRYIIVDLDSSFHERNSTIINVCDKLFWTLTPSEVDFYRTKETFERNLFNAHIDDKKTLYILNKKGQQLNQECLQYNIKFDAELKFNIEWLDYCEDEKIKSDISFGETLYKLMKNDFFEVEVDEHEQSLEK